MKTRQLAIVASLAALTIPLFAACGGDGENGGPGEIRTESGLGVALVAAIADLTLDARRCGRFPDRWTGAGCPGQAVHRFVCAFISRE
jgi:hypothetical protein